jgi:hypothetical protein
LVLYTAFSHIPYVIAANAVWSISSSSLVLRFQAASLQRQTETGMHHRSPMMDNGRKMNKPKNRKSSSWQEGEVEQEMPQKVAYVMSTKARKPMANLNDQRPQQQQQRGSSPR